MCGRLGIRSTSGEAALLMQKLSWSEKSPELNLDPCGLFMDTELASSSTAFRNS
jgi:hypothetical protein